MAPKMALFGGIRGNRGNGRKGNKQFPIFMGNCGTNRTTFPRNVVWFVPQFPRNWILNSISQFKIHNDTATSQCEVAVSLWILNWEVELRIQFLYFTFYFSIFRLNFKSDFSLFGRRFSGISARATFWSWVGPWKSELVSTSSTNEKFVHGTLDPCNLLSLRDVPQKQKNLNGHFSPKNFCEPFSEKARITRTRKWFRFNIWRAAYSPT